MDEFRIYNRALSEDEITDLVDGNCTNDDTKTITCGSNSDGIQIQECISGTWENSGECQLPSGSFFVGGDLDTFYPVIFSDTDWSNRVTDVDIYRTSVHKDARWRGSIVANFKFHTKHWGHRSHFIEADIKQYRREFVAGWHDATTKNTSSDVVIWFRGGGTTYYYRANGVMAQPQVFDTTIFYESYPGHSNGTDQLPHPPKTSVDSYVNGNGLSLGNDLVVSGKVGIGTNNPVGYKLAVDGTIAARDVITTTESWADYVFDYNYDLMPLEQVEEFIQSNNHLPGVPSEREVIANGVSVNEMQKTLLEKVEELTLHMIELNKKNKELNKRFDALIEFE